LNTENANATQATGSCDLMILSIFWFCKAEA
jgi:hypothetical protein